MDGNWKNELRSINVDVDGAIERFSNKEERYVKYLKLFKNNSGFNNLLIALENGDCNAAFENCHSLKGVIGNLGFTSMFPNIYSACEILRTGSMEGVSELIEEITGNYNDIVSIIDRYLM